MSLPSIYSVIHYEVNAKISFNIQGRPIFIPGNKVSHRNTHRHKYTQTHTRHSCTKDRFYTTIRTSQRTITEEYKLHTYISFNSFSHKNLYINIPIFYTCPLRNEKLLIFIGLTFNKYSENCNHMIRYSALENIWCLFIHQLPISKVIFWPITKSIYSMFGEVGGYLECEVLNMYGAKEVEQDKMSRCVYLLY